MKKNPLKYTAAAIKVIAEDIKKIAIITKIATMVITLFYLVFMIIRGLGNLYANIALLCLFVSYSIFDLATFINAKEHKVVRKHAKRTYRILKILIKAVVLGSSLYALSVATSNTSFTTLIATVLSLIFWILSVLLEIVIFVIERRIALIKESISKDMEITLQPITKAKNFFKRIKGEEEITPASESKMFTKLKKKADEEELVKNGEIVEQEVIEEKPKKKKRIKIPLIGKK